MTLLEAAEQYQQLIESQASRQDRTEDRLGIEMERYRFWSTLEEKYGKEFALRVHAVLRQ